MFLAGEQLSKPRSPQAFWLLPRQALLEFRGLEKSLTVGRSPLTCPLGLRSKLDKKKHEYGSQSSD